MPHEVPPHAGHHYHKERTTVKEVVDDYECTEPGCDNLDAHPHAHPTHAPGIVSKLKSFLLGPAAADEEYIVEKEVKVTRVHKYDTDHDGHKHTDASKYVHDKAHDGNHRVHDAAHDTKHAIHEIEDKAEHKVREGKTFAQRKADRLKAEAEVAADLARHKAHDAKTYAQRKADRLKDDVEEGAKETKQKANGALASLWAALENTKEKIFGVERKVEQEVEHAGESANEKYHRLKKEALHKYDSTKDHVVDETGRRIDKVRDKAGEYKDTADAEYARLKGSATDKYEKARQRAHEDAEHVRYRVSEGIDKVEETAEEIAARARNAADAASRNVKGNIAKATDTVKNAKDSVKYRVEEASDKVKHNVEDAAHRVHESIEHTKDNIKDKAHQVKAGVKETAHNVKQGVREGVDNVKGTVKEGIHTVEKGAEGIYHRFEQAAECLGTVGPRTQGRFPGYRLGAKPWDGRYNDFGNPVPVTAFYTGLSCLYFLWLARRVWMARNRSKVFLGDGSNELAYELHRDVVVSQTTVAEGRAARTTALLHTENKPAIRKLVDLLKAVEARSAFSTIVPLFLILLGALELSGAYRPLLHLLSLAFLVGNFLQSEYGILAADSVGPGRAIGLATNWAVLLFGSVMGIYLALSCKGCPVA
ncbi:hypothetical protein PhCBS80983_g00931 [Powellomyces hirtus]|uniref:Uncharacterized protein n=1 Tax=Powellomyces hirtus TaxID=109895 RepID=A0A507EEM2_9FUNG|nr:hypothetical protein PhCBS80983_g00931 [Powellomyces hirtus]